MKTKQKKKTDKSSIREQIACSAIASFRIEGIMISTEQAQLALKKISVDATG
ncbi:hypothetical protein [Spirosoma pollinicola]|uniref:hypothetical protein n=1 Tax=Spirosoma pollinicola TaxID=2057025 RepID=UPI0012FE6E8F|nr:hypothetical protein [Spirosoma pollinicola]